MERTKRVSRLRSGRTATLAIMVAAALACGGLAFTSVVIPAGEAAARARSAPPDGTAREATENTPLEFTTTATAMPITRRTVMARGKTWVDAAIPYSNDDHHDGYRQDCSGFVSFAWAADMSYSTDSLDDIGYRIEKHQLLPGDIMLWQNPNWPQEFGHVRIFGGWLDAAQSRYWVYEQTPPHTLYSEYTWADTFPKYLPFRYYNIRDDMSGVLSDVTGDGRADVLARDADGVLWVYPHDGRTGGGNPYLTRYSAGGGWNLATALTTGDVTGDGRPDVLARDASSELWVYPHDGRTGTGNPYVSRYSAGVGWNGANMITTGDVTGDGRPDVLARTDDGVLWIYPHDGRTGAGNPYVSRYTAGGGWNLATALLSGDVNGDGRPDALARDANGELWIYVHDGRAGTGNPYLSRYSAGVGWNLATALT